MRACGIDTEATHQPARGRLLHQPRGAASSATRRRSPAQDSLTGDWYDCSAHMLWIGERTRQLDGAHVEFLRGVGNPLGCKIGPTATADDVLELCEALNPARDPRPADADHPDGRRPGRGPAAAAAARGPRRRPSGACGPATRCTATPSRRPTAARPATSTTSCAEIAGFVRAHRAEGTWPGGIHVELTGDNVTECLGGADEMLDAHLDDRYETMLRPAPQRPPEPRPGVPRRRAAARRS